MEACQKGVKDYSDLAHFKVFLLNSSRGLEFFDEVKYSSFKEKNKVPSKKIVKKLAAAYLGLSLGFFPVPQFSFAAEPLQKTTSQTTSTVAVSSVPAASAAKSSDSKTVSNSNEFLVRGSSLLSSSKNPLYSTTGTWGQSYDDLWWVKGKLGINADKAWPLSTGKGVMVAVVDTGVDYTHPALVSNMWMNEAEVNGLPGVDDDGNGYRDDLQGWDFENPHLVNSSTDPKDLIPKDDMGHGTHVASIITGVAPDAEILAVKTMDKYGSGTLESIAEGIKYAAAMGAKVINLSLGAYKKLFFDKERKILLDAVTFAQKMGSILVVAAGNEYTWVSDIIPASFAGVITVGAMTAKLKRADFSNSGKGLDFIAPGEDIAAAKSRQSVWLNLGSPTADRDYIRFDGTSMATPMISGIIALLLSAFPDLTFDQIYDRLKRSAKDLGKAGYDDDFGWGLPNAFAALTINSLNNPSGQSLSGTSANSVIKKAGFIKVPAMPQLPGFSGLSHAGKITVMSSGQGAQAHSAAVRKIKEAIRQIAAKNQNPLYNHTAGEFRVALSSPSQALVMATPKSAPVSTAKLSSQALPYVISLGDPVPGSYTIPKEQWKEPAINVGVVPQNHTFYKALIQAVGSSVQIKQAAVTKKDNLNKTSWEGTTEIKTQDGYVYTYDTAMIEQCIYAVKMRKGTGYAEGLCIDDTTDVYALATQFPDGGKSRKYYYLLKSISFPSGNSTPESQPGWGAGPAENLSGCTVNSKYKDGIKECPSIVKIPGTVAITVKRGSMASATANLKNIIEIMRDQAGVKPLWVSIPPSSYDRDKAITFFIRWNPNEASNVKVAQTINDAVKKDSALAGLTAFAEWLPEKAI